MAEITRYIKHRRDANANWTSNDPTLLSGQFGIVTDSANDGVKLKIGDGVTAWNSLPYFNPASSSQTLAQTLALGNTSGANDLIMDDDQSIHLGSSSASSLKYNSISQNARWVNNNGGQGIYLTDTGGIYLSTVSASKVLITDGSGYVVSGMDASFLDATSSIQTQLNARELLSNKGAANGYAPLDGSSKIPTTYLPALAITDTFVVGSQAAMLALTAETGDVAVRTDLNKTYILQGTNPTILADWQEMLTPTDTVLSVNGGTGAVTITTTGTTNRISVSGGGGLTPTIDIDSNYVGQASITTLGTIGTGTWQGTSISTTYTDAKIKGSLATINRIPYISATDTLTSSANLTYNGTALVLTSGSASFSGNGALMTVNSDNSNNAKIGLADAGTVRGYIGASSTASFNVLNNTGANIYMSVLSAGNINFGNYGSPSGQRLVTIGQGTAYASFGERVTTGGSFAWYIMQSSPNASNWCFRSDGADVLVNATAGGLSFQTNNTNRYVISGTTGVHTWTTANMSGGSAIYFNWTAGNTVTATASTAVPKAKMTMGTCQWATGAGPSIQPWYHITQGTGSAVGASTFPVHASFYIEGAVIAGTNMTQTVTAGLYIDNLASVSSAGTSYGAYIKAQTGGTLNYAIGVDGSVTLATVGSGLLIKEGTNATMGKATLVDGTVVVNTTKVTANSRIFLTAQNNSGTVASVSVSARTAGTSFTITSLNVLDTSDIAWMIVEPT